MKNTAKNILALVFAVAMICTLAVPAFAAEKEYIDVDVTLVGLNVGTTVTYGTPDSESYEAEDEKIELGDTLDDVLKEADSELGYTYSATKGVSVATIDEALEAAEADGAWVVAVNGVVVSAYKDYVMADGDEVVIYWADDVMATKLVMVDYEQALKGVISFYSIDAEGNRQPVVGMSMNVKVGDVWATNMLTAETNVIGAQETNASNTGLELFVTDEAGQIWLSPNQLAAIDADKESKIGYANVAIDAAEYLVKVSADEYDEDLAAYYTTFGALNYVTAPATAAATIEAFDGQAYDAPNTGDMTFVYVLVATVAVVTLGAVVVMRKKANKAN